MEESQRRSEEGSAELLNSKLEPYMETYMAIHSGESPHDAAQRLIAPLPLEDRYLWRVVNALNWAFGDFDSETIKLDLMTLSEEQLKKATKELLTFRPFQFCRLLRTLVGEELMREIMSGAIRSASGDEHRKKP